MDFDTPGATDRGAIRWRSHVRRRRIVRRNGNRKRVPGNDGRARDGRRCESGAGIPDGDGSGAFEHTRWVPPFRRHPLKALRELDQPARRHAGRLASTDNKMVKDPHADQLQRIAQLSGDVAVCGAGFAHS